MKVEIGSVIIPHAAVKRYIDFLGGMPYSMIDISYVDRDVDDGELVEAFKANTILPFECEILKTKVLVHGFGGGKARSQYFVLRELASEVSCSYKSISFELKIGKAYQPRFGKEKAIIIPENVKREFELKPEELRLLPYFRLIPKNYIPKACFE